MRHVLLTMLISPALLAVGAPDAQASCIWSWSRVDWNNCLNDGLAAVETELLSLGGRLDVVEAEQAETLADVLSIALEVEAAASRAEAQAPLLDEHDAQIAALWAAVEELGGLPPIDALPTRFDVGISGLGSPGTLVVTDEGGLLVGGFFENSVALFDASGGLIWEDIELGEPAARVSVALDPVTGDPHALRQDNSSTGSILRFHKDFGFVRDVEFVAAQMLAYLPDGRQVLTGPLGVQIDALDTAFPTGYRGVARDVAVGTDGSIYVADGNQIFHLDGTTGETLHRLEGLESLTGIGVSDAGRVYVVDQAASTISVFSAELTFLKSRETIDELGEPFRPWDVAVMEDGRVAVSDPEPGSDIFLFPTF